MSIPLTLFAKASKIKNMKIIAFDTSTKFLCVAVWEEQRLCEYSIETGRLLSTLLSLHLDRILKVMQWKIGDIDYFACGVGPGSFTGLRIGLAAMKGLAFSLKKPVIPVSSLDILAHNAAKSLEKNLIIAPVIDAKRGMVYTSFYKVVDGKIKRPSSYQLLPKEEFIKKLNKVPTAFCGDGLAVYQEDIRRKLGELALFMDKDYWHPRCRGLIQIALDKINAGEISDAKKILPLYLYPQDCQVK